MHQVSTAPLFVVHTSNVLTQQQKTQVGSENPPPYESTPNQQCVYGYYCTQLIF